MQNIQQQINKLSIWQHSTLQYLIVPSIIIFDKTQPLSGPQKKKTLNPLFVCQENAEKEKGPISDQTVHPSKLNTAIWLRFIFKYFMKQNQQKT